MTPLTTFLRDRPSPRGLATEGLNAVGRFLVHSSVSDKGGGQTDTYTPAPTADWTKTTNVPCRIDSMPGRRGESEVASRIADRSTALVYLPMGTPVTLEDDFQIQGIGRYEITVIRANTNEFVRVIEVTEWTEAA
jgi:hypothetical protein